MKKTVTLILVGVLFGSTLSFASTKLFPDVPSNTWYQGAVENLATKGIITGHPDGTFGPANNVNRAELAVMLDRLIEYIETGEVLNEYVNEAFEYRFVILEDAFVDTQNMVIYPIEHEKAIEVGVEFEDGSFANLSSMREEGTFPELKDRLNLTAEEYIQEWWGKNKYDDNPNTDIILSPVFEETINGITWFGFEADRAISFAGGGGMILSEPMTVMMTKHMDTFYRWRLKSDAKNNLLLLLENFDFL